MGTRPVKNPLVERLRQINSAKLFAKAVNDFQQHIVKEQKWEMFLWADRLLDARTMGYGEWESARNGTAGAVDLIPKDIVLCDWHYELRANYPSVPFLVEKGSRVWPAGWKSMPAAQAFSEFSRQQKSGLVVGYLCTTWGAVQIAAPSVGDPTSALPHHRLMPKHRNPFVRSQTILF